MDYSKPTDDGQKYPPPHGGDQPPPVGTSDTPSGSNHYHPPQPRAAAAPGQWTTGLFDCLEDIPNSFITFLCPCITFGQIAEIVDRGATSCGASGALYALIAFVTGWPCLYSCFYRTKMRRQYALPESVYQTPVPDILVHGCCEFCALCQEYRELQNRGFNMAIGWDGNVDNQNQGHTTAPVVEGGMSR